MYIPGYTEKCDKSDLDYSNGFFPDWDLVVIVYPS